MRFSDLPSSLCYRCSHKAVSFRYSEELAAAIGHGAEAEAKLRVELDDIALDVIFQGPESARIYNRGVVSRLSKSLLTTFFRGGTHSGGQLVLRGWQACEKFKQKTGSNSGSSTPAGRSGTPASSHTPRSSLDTKSTAGESSATAAVQGYGSSLYDMQSSIASGLSRYWYANQKEGSTEPGRQTPQTVAEQATSSSSQQQTVTEPPEAADATIQNLQQPAEEGAPQQRAEPKHPEELVLCIHGIGQKLADTYDRVRISQIALQRYCPLILSQFSFVHAVNELRTHAARHSSDPAFSDVIKGKRLQFLPVRWRSQLQRTYDPCVLSCLQLTSMAAVHESKTHRSGEGDEDPFEDNEYSIRDVEPAGMSSLRAVVSDICLDVPHYMSHHRQNMVKVVVQEANRIYRLFCQRNPGFSGKVSIIAHSLGGPIAVDASITFAPLVCTNALNMFGPVTLDSQQPANLGASSEGPDARATAFLRELLLQHQGIDRTVPGTDFCCRSLTCRSVAVCWFTNSNLLSPERRSADPSTGSGQDPGRWQRRGS